MWGRLAAIPEQREGVRPGWDDGGGQEGGEKTEGESEE